MAKKQIFYINVKNCGTKKSMWKEQEGTPYTIEGFQVFGFPSKAGGYIISDISSGYMIVKENTKADCVKRIKEVLSIYGKQYLQDFIDANTKRAEEECGKNPLFLEA